jgi:hypothetical protein
MAYLTAKRTAVIPTFAHKSPVHFVNGKDRISFGTGYRVEITWVIYARMHHTRQG